MKKKIILIIIIVIAIILLVPIPMRLKDGGSIRFQALLYNITKLGIYSVSGNIYPVMLFTHYFNCTKWMSPLQRNNNDRQFRYKHCLIHKTLRHKIS